jgi:spermidine/putrescine transport system permease protein
MKANTPSLLILNGWLLLFSFIPLVFVLITSILTTDENTLVSLHITFTHYKSILSPIYAKIFFRSLCLAMITSMLCLLFAYPFCYFLIHSKYKKLLLLLIIIPFWTSSLIRTYALIAMLKAKGIINMLLLKLHFVTHPLNILYTNTAVVIGLVYNLLPFMILPLYANMERFDFRLLEAAKDLGANNKTLFYRILLPNTLDGIIAGLTFVLLPAMTLFYIPNILGGSKSMLLGNLIQDQFLVFSNWPQGAATSMLLSVIIVVLLACYRFKNSGAIG